MNRVPLAHGRGHVTGLALLGGLALSGCGYVGDPLPPALHIPERVTDLRAVQRGDRIVIDFTLPALTTEGLPVRKGGSIELRVGTVDEPFSVERWAETAASVETQASGHAEAPARNWYGRDVVVGVRLVTDQGRRSEWSNFVTVAVAEPLATPYAITAAPHAKGVRVSWQSPSRENVQFRVHRQSETEKETTVVATVPGMEYIDTAVAAGKRYEYSVQAFLANTESDVSAAASVTAADVFAPAPPTGLNAVVSLNSIELGWERNAEVDLAYYRVFRGEADGPMTAIADKVETPAFSDKQITSGTSYRYAVAAVDAAGNEGERTAPIQVVAP